MKSRRFKNKQHERVSRVETDKGHKIKRKSKKHQEKSRYRKYIYDYTSILLIISYLKTSLISRTTALVWQILKKLFGGGYVYEYPPPNLKLKYTLFGSYYSTCKIDMFYFSSCIHFFVNIQLNYRFFYFNLNYFAQNDYK